jgi:hypothetical protein
MTHSIPPQMFAPTQLPAARAGRADPIGLARN